MSTSVLQTVPCPFCGSNRNRHWGEENGFEAVKCVDCGLVFVNPRPPDHEMLEAARLGQHGIDSGRLDVAYRRSDRKVRRYRARVTSLFEKEIRAGTPLKWLDIGAGYGELVEALTAVLPAGSEIMGIEPMERKVRAAQALGLNISSRPLSEITSGFDVVSMINILSHLPDPDVFLADVFRLVKPGGTLLLITGTGGDLSSRSGYPDQLDLPDHLIFAGRLHVEGYLARNGFRIEDVDERRLDTLTWSVKNVVKRAIGRGGFITAPYRSKFRDIAVKARRL